MPDEVKATAPVERRVAALEQAFEERNLIPTGFIDKFAHTAQAADPATVHVGVFESYLERAP